MEMTLSPRHSELATSPPFIVPSVSNSIRLDDIESGQKVVRALWDRFSFHIRVCGVAYPRYGTAIHLLMSYDLLGELFAHSVKTLLTLYWYY